VSLFFLPVKILSSTHTAGSLKLFLRVLGKSPSCSEQRSSPVPSGTVHRSPQVQVKQIWHGKKIIYKCRSRIWIKRATPQEWRRTFVAVRCVLPPGIDMCNFMGFVCDRTIDLFPCEIYTGMKGSVNFIILNITDDHDRWTLCDDDFVKSSLKTYMYSVRKCKLINGELGWNYHTVHWIKKVYTRTRGFESELTRADLFKTCCCGKETLKTELNSVRSIIPSLEWRCEVAGFNQTVLTKNGAKLNPLETVKKRFSIHYYSYILKLISIKDLQVFNKFALFLIKDNLFQAFS